MIQNQSELYHHGVRGMKWGVRRYQNSSGRLTSLGKKRKQPDAKYDPDYAKAHTKKDVRTMSDKELRDRLNRLNMEEQYKQKTTNIGKNYMNKMIKAGTTVATVTTTALTIYNNYGKIKSILGRSGSTN